MKYEYVMIRPYLSFWLEFTAVSDSLNWFQIEYRARQEALRLKELEAKQLEKQYGKKKAREVAEQKFQVTIFRKTPFGPKSFRSKFFP
jgi:hypothetical protein